MRRAADRPRPDPAWLHGANVLRPQETATRERKSLSGLWQFALDADGVGRDEGWWNGPLAGAREVPVPASYNDIFADAEVHNHVGDVWYQTLVRVPAGGPASGSSCASTPPPTGRCLGERHPGRRAPGRLHTVRGRRHRRGRAGRREPDHRGGEQRPDLADDPAGLRA